MPIKDKQWVGPSKSEQHLLERDTTPAVSALMVKGISQYRRDKLSEEVELGLFRDGSVPSGGASAGLTSNSYVSSAIGTNKYAQAVSSSGGGFRGGNGDTVKQAPEVYSPLWLNSNMSFPRDRATINAWCRSFFALNPFVSNAINLHSTYPISKLNIKCANKEAEKFFNDMIEEIDLFNICVQIAQEYWLLGEAFVYAELDQSQGKWSRLVIQNPDYMIVQRTAIASDPMIMLRPDENLKKIIFSNRPNDIEQRKQLPQNIIDSVKKGGNIPLDNFHVSHLARRISPYEIRGTGLPVCVFRNLMLFDRLRESKFAQADNLINPLTLVKIGSADFKPTPADIEAWRNVFECHDEETEVLTDNGFKKFNEVIEYTETVNGITDVKPKDGFKIACFNAENEQLEYHTPLNASLYNYNGDMHHFSNKKIDIKVTPNHKMWASKREVGSKYNKWNKLEAKDININNYYKLRSQANWTGKEIDNVKILNKNIPVEVYLEYLGYLLSEGSVYTTSRHYYTSICQSTITEKKYQPIMSKCADEFSKYIDLDIGHSHRKSGMWSATFSNKSLYQYFKNEIGTNNDTLSNNKHIPAWIFELSPRLLNILLNAMVKGDGSIYSTRVNNFKYCRYSTTSKKLADGIYEIIYKCGYVPILSSRNIKNGIEYVIGWSEEKNSKGQFPVLHNSNSQRSINPLTIENYNGKVWCFQVPTGLFITRRNGKITIQANSAQYDKDFKIFTHEAVTIERVGAGSGIYDISGDITQLIKEIYVGLQVPSVIMDGGADTTYANGGVALDVLRQRYVQFRNYLTSWLKNKIFAPISKIQGFYDIVGGSKQLTIPEVEWNHMSLFDTSDYIQTLVTITAGTDDQKRASLHTLYKSMGLDYADEQRKIKKEAIQNAIAKKEKEALDTMDLNSLRTLGDDDEIPEPENTEQKPGDGAPLPGESASPAPSMPGLDLGSPPPPPPPPSGNTPPPPP